MGLTSPAARYDLTPYFSEEIHPVEGQVPLFKLKGYSLFLFMTENTSVAFAKTAEQIQKENNQHLCPYYGNLFTKETVSFDRQYLCCSGLEKKSCSFWTYHNYSLADEIQFHEKQRKYPEEEQIWKLIRTLVQSALLLMKYDLYVDFCFKNILVSPMKQKQLYWGNSKEDNSHRNFYQATFKRVISKSQGFSPEELRALIKQKSTAKFDLEKCVMHSLGRLILLYANNQYKFSEIIDFDELTFKQQQIDKMMKMIGSKYSRDLLFVVKNALSPSPIQRSTFSELKRYFQSPGYSQLQAKLRQRKSVLTSPTSIGSQDSPNHKKMSEF